MERGILTPNKLKKKLNHTTTKREGVHRETAHPFPFLYISLAVLYLGHH